MKQPVFRAIQTFSPNSRPCPTYRAASGSGQRANPICREVSEDGRSVTRASRCLPSAGRGGPLSVAQRWRVATAALTLWAHSLSATAAPDNRVQASRPITPLLFILYRRNVCVCVRLCVSVCLSRWGPERAVNAVNNNAEDTLHPTCTSSSWQRWPKASFSVSSSPSSSRAFFS